MWTKVKSNMRILYPVPTLWSAHTIIALDDKAKVLLNAFKDPQIQAIAWKKHGFRTGVSGVVNNVGDVPVAGVPAQITQVIQTPSPDVINAILAALKNQ
ncbi:hypothetical protein [Ethanoligenens harbinense]|uniref:hypothetical protein n=1 Tax=Ethanoligenens harbinense TaxID=253239 RepID=UPI000EA20C54|nr:hypothetical protein [Ethanoligenens harbinense]AYF42288.1 hypothetical protein CN246_12095 [Ethanoligenens harbinense]